MWLLLLVTLGWLRSSDIDKNWYRLHVDVLSALIVNLFNYVNFSEPVVEFFCFDDPPGPHESLEESRVR